MRQAGTLSSEQEARVFADYLVAEGIKARVDQAGDGWAIWVYDEAVIDRSRAELATYLQDPNDSRYTRARGAAQASRRAEVAQVKEAKRNFIELRDRWDAAPRRVRPVTVALILASAAISLLTQFGKDPTYASELWIALRRGDLSLILQGQVWRLVTPIFIHMDPLHLLFNMYWLYALGGLIETRRGSWRLAVMVLVIAVGSNLGELYGGKSPHFGGMSGVVYGLFGYAWMKSRFDPRANIYVDPQTVVIMLLWFLACAVGFIENVANYAHGVGLVIGCAIAYVPLLFRRRAE